MTTIGFATLSVIPSFEGFRRKVESDAGREMAAAGKSGGIQFGTAASRAIAEAGSDGGREFGDKAGKSLSTAGRVGGEGFSTEASKALLAAGGDGGEGFGKEAVKTMASAGREAGINFGDSATDSLGSSGTKSGVRFGGLFQVAALASGAAVGAALGDEMEEKLAEAGRSSGEAFGTEAAETGGRSFSSKIGGLLKGGALAAGGAAAVAFGVGLSGALEQGALSDKLAAQLGIGEQKSAKLGKVAGELYSNAYGDSLEGVNGALRAVVTNLDGFRNASKDKLKDVTASVLDLNAAFEEEPDAIARAASQMVRTDLAKGPKQALNIITRGFQSGADKSHDLLDTFNEYGTQFRKLGLNGKKATGLLSQGLQGGARDADLVADALKEFSLKTTEPLLKMTQTVDGPKASLTALGEAFKAAGVDALDADPKMAKLADRLQADIAGGGEKATAGLQLLLDGLRKTDDPLERSRNAVALFGTQAEDMGDALLSLDPSKAEKDLGRVGDAAKKMGATLSDNASTKIETFKRTMQTKLVNFVAEEFIPFFEDDVLPILEDFSDWFKRDGADALRDFGGDVKDITGKVETLVGFLNDLPKPAKVGGLVALVGGVGAAKIRGGGSGALGSAGKVLGVTKPVNVFVTNKGFGTDVDGGGGGGGGKMGWLTKIGGAATIASVAIPVVDRMLKDNAILKWVDDAGGKTNDYFTGKPLVPTKPEARPFGLAAPGAGLTIEGGDKAQAMFDELTAKARGFNGVLDLVGNRKIDPTLTVPGLDKAHRDLQAFLSQQIEARKPITPYVTLTGYDRALAQIETLTAKIHAIPTAGIDNSVPYASGGGTSAGIINNFTGPITATDTKDITRQAQRKAQQRGLGGRP